MDTEFLQDQIKGTEAAIKELRATERKMIKKNTLAEQVNKLIRENAELEISKGARRAEKDELIKQRNDIVGKSTTGLGDVITKFLPYGTAVIGVVDDEFSLGWSKKPDTNTESVLVPYSGLSGGEKAIFDTALQNALMVGGKHRIVINEMAEVDDNKFFDAIKKIGDSSQEAQVVFNCWNNVENAGEGEREGWKITNLT